MKRFQINLLAFFFSHFSFCVRERERDETRRDETRRDETRLNEE